MSTIQTMKNVNVFLILMITCFLIEGCSLGGRREKEAITLVQQTKMEHSGWEELLGKTAMTWGEYANKEAVNNPTKTYAWDARQFEDEIFLVGFRDNEGWGIGWEVSMKSKTVRNVNASQHLSFKYGFSRLDTSGVFQVTDIVLDTLKHGDERLTYQLKGSILNNTGKTITSASLNNSNVNIVFEEKDVVTKGYVWNCTTARVSENTPWREGTKIEFSVIIDDIKTVYLHYDPIAVFFILELKAKDPIGFNYDKAIYKIDLFEQWRAMQQIITSKLLPVKS